MVDKYDEMRGISDAPDVELENDGIEQKQLTKVKEKEEDDVEIVVEDDTPEKDKGRKPLDKEVNDPTDEELDKYSEGVQKRMSELTHARHDERRRAEKYERENAELVRALQALRKREKEKNDYISMGQKAYIEQAKKHATYAITTAKQQLKQAYDAGDGEAITAAQEALTQAQIDLQQASNWHPTQLQEEPEPAYTPSNNTASQRQVDTRTQDWVADNPWFQRPGDEDMTYYAMSVHARLVREHGDAYTKTQAYFDDIDRDMRKAFPAKFKDSRNDTEEESSAPRRRAPSNVAPTQRDSKTSRKRIRLTQSQVDLAKKLGVPLEIYAKELALTEANNG